MKGALCPGVKVTGVLIPEMLKPVPVTVTCVIVRLDPPVLLSVSDWVWLVPVCTLPKLMLAGAAPNVPGNGSVPPPCEAGLLVLNPWQPSIVARASTTTSAFRRARRVLMRTQGLFRPTKRAQRLVCPLNINCGRSRKGIVGDIRRPWLSRSLPRSADACCRDIITAMHSQHPVLRKQPTRRSARPRRAYPEH